MKNVKLLKWTAILAIVGLAIWGMVKFRGWWNPDSEPVPVAKMEEAKIIDIRPMVRLCSMEIYEDVPIKGSIGSRHLFAKATLTGTISFDLEKTECHWEGDTLVVTLPPEIVTIRESTERGAYKVIDRWNDKFLRSASFTNAEENEIKRKAVDKWRDAIYSRGYVKRARVDAVNNLNMMIRPFVEGKEVRIVDPSPDGYEPRTQ